jgi:predicted O-methyltransferase YrrM
VAEGEHLVWLWPRYWLRRLLFATPLRRLVFPRYQYAFTPRQLAILLDLVDEARAQPGEFIEIGCFVGATTIFLNRHLQTVHDQRRYLAVDTFAGFIRADVAIEEQERGKVIQQVERDYLFSMNKKSWFDYTMSLNRINNVTSIAGDISEIKIADHSKGLCFALIDVDLYVPTCAALKQVWPLLAPGGIIVIDDCTANQVFDGSRAAWLEFIQQHHLHELLIADKLAIIRKPIVSA